MDANYITFYEIFSQGIAREHILKPEQGHRTSSAIQHQRLVMQDGESEEKLPSDVLEKVATFLPLASLCRFRAVSKEWNRFISHPDFASKHTRASSPEEYILFAEQNNDDHLVSGGWEVLDVASKRFFNLSTDFLAEFVKQEGNFVHCPPPRLWRSTILAADGGLLCLSCFIDHGCRCCCELGIHEALLVCNPVLKTVKQLPHFAGWSRRPEWVVMSTNRYPMGYEIYFITLAKDASQPNTVYIYESKTASWRTSATVPGHLNTLSGYHELCSNSVILKDEFYGLFIRHDRLYAARLVSYNKMTRALSDLQIDVPCTHNDDDHDSLQLVVSDGRLFCVIVNTDWGKLTIPTSSIKIVEFILARREYIQVSVLGSEMLESFLSDDIYIQVIVDRSECDPPAIAIGLANSIFLCSFAGQSMAYDLSNKTWHKYLDSNSFRGGRRFLDFFGSHLCLSLCPP